MAHNNHAFKRVIAESNTRNFQEIKQLFFYIARFKIILLARARYAFTLFPNQLSALQQLTLITQQVHIYPFPRGAGHFSTLNDFTFSAPPSRRVKNLTIEQAAVYLVRGWSPFCATTLPACATTRRGRGWMWWWTRSKNEAPRLHDANRYGDIYAVMQTPPMRHSNALYDVPWDHIFPREVSGEERRGILAEYIS